MNLHYAASDPYAECSFSGTGVHSDYGYGYHDDKCCPLVVDPIYLGAILLSIAGATVLLGMVIEMEIMMGGRRKRSLKCLPLEGKKKK